MIQLYDTVKDTQGNRYRVVEMTENLASIKGITPDNKTKPGKARTVTIQDLENKFARVDLPPITVTKIAPHEKAMETEAKAIKEMKKETAARTASKAVTPDTIDDLILGDSGALLDADHIEAEHEKEVKMYKAEVKMLRDTNEQTTNQLRVRDQEVHDLLAQVTELEEILVKVRQENKDLTKTISKMKQQHEAEVAELEDEIMELKVIEKKKSEYADALDEDSVAFEKVQKAAQAIVSMADSIETLAYMIQDEAEVKM